jgi:hypothetical protein
MGNEDGGNRRQMGGDGKYNNQPKKMNTTTMIAMMTGQQ